VTDGNAFDAAMLNQRFTSTTKDIAETSGIRRLKICKRCAPSVTQASGSTQKPAFGGNELET